MSVTYGGQGQVPGQRPAGGSGARGILFTAGGLLLIIGVGWKVSHEYEVHGTVMGTPAHQWLSRELGSAEVVAPGGDYKISVRRARLEWRRPYGFLEKGEKSAIRLSGHPGLLLTIREEGPKALRRSDEEIIMSMPGLGDRGHIMDAIDVPAALKGMFFVAMGEGLPAGRRVVQGAFRMSKKLVVMTFASQEPRGSAAVNPDDVAHDIRQIAGSFTVLDADRKP